LLAGAANVSPRVEQHSSVVGGTWSRAIEAPGPGTISPSGDGGAVSIACPAIGDCVAGGGAEIPDAVTTPFVKEETGGRWAPAQLLPGMSALNASGVGGIQAVSCTAPGDCEVVGTYPGGSFVDSEADDVWQAASAMSGTPTIETHEIQLTTLSCASNGSCLAGGTYMDSFDTFQPLLVSEVDGVWGTPIEVPGSLIRNDTEDPHSSGSEVVSVSCSKAGDCVAGGVYQPATNIGVQRAFLVGEANGSWGSAFQIPGVGLNNLNTTEVDSVSCFGPGDCAAGGSATYGPFVVSEIDGKWGRAREPLIKHDSNPHGIGYVAGVSCAGPESCSAAGSDGGSNPQVFIVNEVHGVWQPADPVPGVAGGGWLYAIDCAAPEECSAGGQVVRSTTPRTEGIVVNEVDGLVEPAIAVLGVANVSSMAKIITISCGAPGNCGAAGWFVGAGQAIGIVASEDRAPPPVVSSVSPTIGRAQGGTRVMIHGRGLNDALAVEFGGFEGTHLDVVSATELLVSTPSGKGRVLIRVVAQSGPSRVTSPTWFTYRATTA
jgi:hypothetical protein